jgi:hypothetical protein
MENASKALLIAGGVLIAILIIAMLVYSFGSISGYFEEKNSKEEIDQLTAFNAQYEAYNRKLLRGTDVVSVLNKAISNNEKYEYKEYNYIIGVEFIIKETAGNWKAGKAYNITDYETMKQNENDFTELKRKIFDCTEVEYNEVTGRIDYILFTERKTETGI